MSSEEGCLVARKDGQEAQSPLSAPTPSLSATTRRSVEVGDILLWGTRGIWFRTVRIYHLLSRCPTPEAPQPVKTWRPSATALRVTMVSPAEPRFTPLSVRSLQDDEEAPTEVDDRYLLSPCVTSPLLDDGMEVIAGQSGCVHRWPCWIASAAVVGITLWTLKAHIGVAIFWLAALAEHAGPWGIVATVFVLAVWVMLLMPISLFEVLVGHVFPLRTAPQHGYSVHTP